MAEPQGISRTFDDIAKGLVGAYRGYQGFRGEVGRNIGNVGRFFASQAPVEAPLSAAQQAAADRQMAEVSRLGGSAALRAATTRGVSDAQMMQNNPNLVPPAGGPGGPGGPGGAPRNPINALFAPMFEDLRRQRQLANQRYEANRDQVTNIYGQITGARSADKAASETAFQRLIDAASTRSTAVNTGIDASEAARLQQNQAALQGMGLEGLSTSQGDIASQTAAQAKQTNTLNAANWEGMLRAMGATAGQQVDADVAAFNFAMLEDQGQLRGAREEFMQDLGQQRGELRSQRAQATFEYQQAQQRAAAAAQAAQQRAAQRDATAQEKAAAAALKRSGPVLYGVQMALKDGALDNIESGTKLTTLLTEFLTMGTPPAGETRFNPTSARNAFFTATEGQLNSREQLVAQQILAQIKW
jgi:hypothetical protein